MSLVEMPIVAGIVAVLIAGVLALGGVAHVEAAKIAKLYDVLSDVTEEKVTMEEIFADCPELLEEESLNDLT